MKNITILIVICIFFTFNLYAQENAILRQLLDLPAPPPVAEMEDEIDTKRTHSEEFYKKENVPPDDAPIEDLIDFWKRQNFYEAPHPDKIKPSEKTLKRLVEAVEDQPENLKDFLKLFPVNRDIAEKVKTIFDTNGQSFDESWREEVKKWLKYKSTYFSDELLAEAQNAKDHKTYKTVGKEQELRALAKVDWDNAAPLLERLESDKNNPRTAFFAKRLIYEHAIEKEDSSAIEKYRTEFQKIVENKNASGTERDDALEALVENKEWSGQEKWLLSLFQDQTLLELSLGERTITHPLNGIVSANPDKWIPIVTKLINNSNRAVHNAAVQSLAQFYNKDARKDALEPLLPWISNPDWAKVETDGRFRLIQSMDFIDMPESVPGLLWVLENDTESYTRSYAAESLAKYKDTRIAQAMLDALQKEPEESHRQRIIIALIFNKSLTDDEQIGFLESYVVAISTPEGFKEVEERNEYEDENPLPVAVSIGKYLAMQKEPSEGLILRAIERLKVLEKEKPETAKILSGIMAKWQGRLIDLEMLRKISASEADVETIIGALARRGELKERVLNDLYAMRGKSGLAGALAACMLEDENEILSAFHSQNVEMSIGALACARLLRKPLPVREIGVLLNSNNNLLALAAERYLESEDSQEARNLVWAKHKGEALILGARTSFNPAKQSFSDDYNSPLRKLFSTVSTAFSFSNDFRELDKSENELRKEIVENQNLVAIYAHLPNFDFGGRVVRIFKDHATFTYYEDSARYKVKKINKEDLDKFLQNLREMNINEFKPLVVSCHHDCYVREFISLTRDNGHRIFSGSGFGSLKSLDSIETFFSSGEYQTRYKLQNKINGLEILFADEKYSAKAIWKNGDDFRVLVEDKVKEGEIEEALDRENEVDNKNEDLDWQEKDARRFARKTEREFEHYEWRSFSGGKLAAKTDEPLEIPFLREKLSFPAVKELRNNDNQIQTNYGNYEIRAGEYNTGGLWKINRGERIEFKKGIYANPIVSGNFVVAAKTEGSWAEPNYIVRINLQTGKESKINLPPAEEFNPVAFVAAHNKVLLYRDTEPESKKPAEYYLLDAATGKTEFVKGEFRPLIEQTFRNLQPTGNKDEFWSAIYDKEKNQTVIGRYDAKNFAIKTILTVPEINLNSMQIWVDEKEAKVYFIYQANYFGESHLLFLPLKK